MFIKGKVCWTVEIGSDGVAFKMHHNKDKGFKSYKYMEKREAQGEVNRLNGVFSWDWYSWDWD